MVCILVSIQIYPNNIFQKNIDHFFLYRKMAHMQIHQP